MLEFRLLHRTFANNICERLSFLLHSYFTSLTLPQSITYLIPGIVEGDEGIDVATTDDVEVILTLVDKVHWQNLIE